MQLHLGIENQVNVSPNSSVLQTIVLKKSLTAPKLFPQIDRFLFPVYQDCIFELVTKDSTRLSRATLEFQVPTGLKVFNSQVIYLISFARIFRSKKFSIQDLSLPKKLSFNEFGTREIVSHRFRETNSEKTIWVQKYFGSKKFSDLT